MPSGKRSTPLPVVKSICNRTPRASRGCTSSAIWGSVGMMNCIEHAPKNIALELERANCIALELGCVAMFQRYRERFVGIASRLRYAATDMIESGPLIPGIKLFERNEPRRHQIRCEEF